MEGKQSLKESMTFWSDAVTAHNARNFDVALRKYTEIDDVTARMLYNMACAYVELNDKDNAIKCLSYAVEKDCHLAIAFFQRGTLHLQIKRYTQAISDLEVANVLLRGNTYIDYKQLGLLCRLYSFQVAHNLAAAHAYTGRRAEAVRLLTEALHDADEFQRKLLMTSLERIETSRSDMVLPVRVSTSRVFSPPKSVIENLAKKEIVRKAKVVAGTDVEDRSPSFKGMKRVEELKRLPKATKAHLSPLLAMRRFFSADPTKKPKRRGNGLNAAMKMWKSMTDLRTEENDESPTATTKGKGSPFVPIRRLFRKKCSDEPISPAEKWNSAQTAKMKKCKSMSDLTFEECPGIPSAETPSPNSPGPVRRIYQRGISQEQNGITSPEVRQKRISGDFKDDLMTALKRYPLRPVTGVRKLIIKKHRDKKESSPGDVEVPVLAMRGANSSSDLRNLDESLPRSRSESDLRKQDGYEQLKRQSLGSTFGSYATVVGHLLSLSCDVLTSVVTPVDEKTYVNVQPCEDVSESQAHVYINSDGEFGEISREEPSLNHFYVNDLPRLKQDVKETGVHVNDSFDNSLIRDSSRVNSKVPSKTRPPPPSYPPPQLPKNSSLLLNTA